MIFTQHYESPLGGITMASDSEALTGLWFDGQKHFPDKLPKACSTGSVFAQTRRWLDIYFSGNEPDFTPPISLEGTPFRKSVWEILLTIPYGKTMTYGEIATIIGRMSAQAVGGAVSHNPISIIVPCHRVIGANGSLTGYAGGLDKKMKLLDLEGIMIR